MGSLVLTGDTSGSVTVAVPAVAGTNTATFPAATGTVMVSGNMPAFSAKITANQSISASTVTKVTFNNELFDTNNNYDPTTNYRFTPTVGGYYQINAFINWSGSGTTQGVIVIYKNGSEYGRTYTPGSAFGYYNSISAVIQMNGSTDYIEIYCINSSAETVQSGTYSIFSGSLLRAT